ncbi:MAG: ACP S-malonyltransferase [Planctomycetota bacterium]
MNNTVLLFAGQGAQEVGMGIDVVNKYDRAAEVFDQAEGVIDLDLLDICKDGPDEKLARTDICQPAILTASIALLRALEQELGCPLRPLASAGLSLGEYSALVASGALELRPAVELTHARGQFMQEACDANPGTMYSIIGLDDRKVEEACEQIRHGGGRVWPANYNSPGQVVISGGMQDTQRAADLCAEKGARRAIQLNVAGAFHTPLMQPAADKLRKKLDSTTFSEPDYPVVSNVTGGPVESVEEIRNLLSQQVTSPVRWCRSMQWCAGEGAEQFIELGPGRVLRGLLRRIDRDLDCASVNSLKSLQKTADTI